MIVGIVTAICHCAFFSTINVTIVIVLHIVGIVTVIFGYYLHGSAVNIMVVMVLVVIIVVIANIVIIIICCYPLSVAYSTVSNVRFPDIQNSLSSILSLIFFISRYLLYVSYL